MGFILVTGATGFLGGRLVRHLMKSGIDILAVGRDQVACARLESMGCPVLRHDLAVSFDTLSYSMLGDVEAIVHCAALSSPFGRLDDFLRANVVATTNLVHFARRQNVGRFVYISTPSVYFAFRDQLDVREEDALPTPVNHYARTKRQAEKIVLAVPEAGPVILRPRGIYGSGDSALLPRVLRVARRHALPLFREGKARIDLTHVDDVVDAIVAALNGGDAVEGEIFNISSGEVLPVRDIVDKACARAGIRVRWRPMALAPAMFAAGMVEVMAGLSCGQFEPPVTRYGLGLFAYAQSLDTSKAERVLRWKPNIDFEDGLHRTFQAGGVS